MIRARIVLRETSSKRHSQTQLGKINDQLFSYRKCSSYRNLSGLKSIVRRPISTFLTSHCKNDKEYLFLNNYNQTFESTLNHKNEFKKISILSKYPFIQQQTRNYIFFPSSIPDIKQTLLKSFPSLEHIIHSYNNKYYPQTNLKLKLREKARIQLLSFTFPISKTERLKVKTILKSHLQNVHHDMKDMRSSLKQLLVQKSFVYRKKAKLNWDHMRMRMSQHRSKSNMKWKSLHRRKLLRHYLMSTKNQLLKGKHAKNAALLMLREKYRIQFDHYYKEIWKPKTVVIDEPTRPDWFDKNGYPLTSRHWLTNRFVNPWQSESSDGQQTLHELWKWRAQRFSKQCTEAMGFYQCLKDSIITGNGLGGGGGDPPKIQEYNTLPVAETNIIHHNEYMDKRFFEPSSSDKIRLTWIGHSSCLVSMNGFNLLTDPVFSQRASPFQFAGMGVERSVPPSISLSNLIGTHDNDYDGYLDIIDAVLISHDHYDHLDYESVVKLNHSGKIKYWVVPLGIKQWLMDVCNINNQNIIEMEWWEKAIFHKERNHANQDSSSNDNTVFIRKESHDASPYHARSTRDFTKTQSTHNEMHITCAPTHHWSCRTPFDRNTRLWCSFAVQTTSHTSSSTLLRHVNNVPDNYSLNFYFGGDTAYPKTFPLHRQIGDRLGPFDLAALPIGAYKPEFFMRHYHCNPKEAMQIHCDIQSKKSVGIHWGTFPLADEGLSEPAMELQRVIDERKSLQTTGQNDTSTNGANAQKENNNFSVVEFGCSVESEKKIKDEEQDEFIEIVHFAPQGEKEAMS